MTPDNTPSQPVERRDLYRDRRSPSYPEERAKNAEHHLSTLFKTIQQTTKNNPLDQQKPTVFEIGSGMGGVTKAIKRVFQDPTVITLDEDADPAIQFESLGNNAQTHITQDVTKLADDELKTILDDNNIQYIIALLTSGKVSSHLKEALNRIGYTGLFVFSLMGRGRQQGPDDNEIAASRRDSSQKKCIQMDQMDSPFYTEHFFAYSRSIEQSLKKNNSFSY